MKKDQEYFMDWADLNSGVPFLYLQGVLTVGLAPALLPPLLPRPL